MKNLPKKIYLQISNGDHTVDESIDDFNEIVYRGEVTWADSRINKDDIEYVLSNKTDSESNE